VYQFSVFEARERPGAEGLGPLERHIPGRRIGHRDYQARQTAGISPFNGLIGVVGLATGGLEQFPLGRDGSRGYTPTGHELIELAAGLRPEDLPDRWQGLMPFEALVWTGSGGEYEPSDIKDAQAEAIREWVRRGGHLIIVLPSVGQGWYGSGAGVNPIAEIMPVVTPTLMEGVDLNPYRAMLTNDREVSLPSKGVALWKLGPAPGSLTGAGAGPYDAMPILAGPAGEPVVVRRLVGTGAVTVLGLDPTRRDLSIRNALQAHVFWNRILGKRASVLSAAEIDGRQKGIDPAGRQLPTPEYIATPVPVEFDLLIGDRINKSASAAAGLLMAFVVFLAYWLLAGPVGYLALKHKGRRQHAWVAFLGVSAAFTLVGWGGASLLKLRRDVDQHLTFVDHVYGQSNQRMRSWIELTLPAYGEQRVSVAAPSSAAEPGSSEWHHTLTSWQPSSVGNGIGSFPDARAYTVDARSPDTADFPARATTRQLQVDYAGSVPADWGMPRPVVGGDLGDVPLGEEIGIVETAGAGGGGGQSGQRRWEIRGALTHSLPGDLRDVVVVVNLGQSNYGRRPGMLLSQPWSVALTTPWAPNTVLELDKIIPREGGQSFEQALQRWRGEVSGRGLATPGLVGGPEQGVDPARAYLALAFFSMLTPPDAVQIRGDERVLAARQSTHGWDLGRWFTQPCIMIVGTLGDKAGKDAVECPVPISIDGTSGDVVRKGIMGTTVIRWVYPLKARPPELPKASEAEELPGAVLPGDAG
jgi:hypothetical protein